jgi:hypothetical protein
MTQKAGGAGDIWNQKYEVHGSTRSWLILSSLSSITGGWATMATNIPDFTVSLCLLRLTCGLKQTDELASGILVISTRMQFTIKLHFFR